MGQIPGEIIVVQQPGFYNLFWFLGVFFFIFFILIPLVVLIVNDIADADNSNVTPDAPIILQNEDSGLYLIRNTGALTVSTDRLSGLPIEIRGTETRGVYILGVGDQVVGGRNGQIFLDSPTSFGQGTYMWYINNEHQIISSQQSGYVMAVVNSQLVYRTQTGISGQSYEWVQILSS